MKKTISMLAMLSLIMFSVFSCDAMDEGSGGAFYIKSSAIDSPSQSASLTAVEMGDSGATMAEMDEGSYDTEGANMDLSWGNLPEGANYLYVFMASVSDPKDTGDIDWAVEVDLNNFKGDEIPAELGQLGGVDEFKDYGDDGDGAVTATGVLVDTKGYRLVGFVTSNQVVQKDTANIGTIHAALRDADILTAASITFIIHDSGWGTPEPEEDRKSTVYAANKDTDTFLGFTSGAGTTITRTAYQDASPALEWDDIPADANTLVILMKPSDASDNKEFVEKDNGIWFVEVDLTIAQSNGLPAGLGFLNHPEGVVFDTPYPKLDSSKSYTLKLYAIKDTGTPAYNPFVTVGKLENILNHLPEVKIAEITVE